jgi:hypothetical protein
VQDQERLLTLLDILAPHWLQRAPTAARQLRLTCKAANTAVLAAVTWLKLTSTTRSKWARLYKLPNLKRLSLADLDVPVRSAMSVAHAQCSHGRVSLASSAIAGCC